MRRMWVRSAMVLMLSLGSWALAQQPDAGVDAFAVKVEPGRGLTVSRGESLSFNVRARIQLRDVVSVAETTSNELSVRTARVAFGGTAFSPDVRYSALLAFGAGDFEAGNPSPLLDAFLEYTGWRDLNVRLGQFFVPFDRARTIREYALQFVDRPQVVSELNLDRDMGVMLSSQDLFGLGGRLAYALGLFSGQGRNRLVAEKPGFLYVARATVRPMGPFDDDAEGDLQQTPTPHVAFGVAAAFNQDTSRQKSTTGTVFTLGGFDQTHLAADVVFKWRGVSLLAEVLYRHANAAVHEGEVNGAPFREFARSGWGYVVQAGVLVHERVEVAARWNQLRFLAGDPALEALVRQQGREFGVGANVYVNRHLAKVQLDWSVRFGDVGLPTHLVRVSVDVSF